MISGSHQQAVFACIKQKGWGCVIIRVPPVIIDTIGVLMNNFLSNYPCAIVFDNQLSNHYCSPSIHIGHILC